MGTIEQTAVILAALIRGHAYERNSLARAFGFTVAAADRYIRALAVVPGIKAQKQGRRLFVSFSFGDALKECGR